MTFEEEISQVITKELDRRMELRLESYKQRVKEAIKKFKSLSENRWTDKQIEEFLIKELNLE